VGLIRQGSFWAHYGPSTPRIRVPVYMLTVIQVVFKSLYVADLITVFTPARHWNLFWAICTLSHTHPSHSTQFHFNIILPFAPKFKDGQTFLSERCDHSSPNSVLHAHLLLPSGFFPSVFPNILHAPLSYTCHMPRPSYPSQFYHPSNIWWRVQMKKLLIMLSPPVLSYLVGPNIFLSTLLSKTLSLQFILK